MAFSSLYIVAASVDWDVAVEDSAKPTKYHAKQLSTRVDFLGILKTTNKSLDPSEGIQDLGVVVRKRR